MTLNDFTGVWLAPLKGEIPNYNSNFTNWVEGTLADGNLKLIVESSAQEVTLKLEVPVLFSSGLGGYRLYDGRLSLLDDCLSLDQGGISSLLIPIERVSSENLVLTFFDKALLFVKVDEG